jgi:hypothetical protein
MTGRERLTAVLQKTRTDRLPWTTLVDNATLAGLPVDLQGNGGLDFYRHLGCDLFLLNGWNTPYSFRSPELRWGPEVRVEHGNEGRTSTTTWHTPRGSLVAARERSHPVKYPVDSLEAVRLYRSMWEGASYAAYDDSATLAELDAAIGGDGVTTRFWGPSTVPRLLEEDMGTQSFYYLLADHPAEMDGLIRTIHEREREAYAALAGGPWGSVTLVENTSTFYISPQVYRTYNMPHQQEFVAAARAAGKTAILHMCGHVRLLLDLIKETGCDGIHALTPPPTGDTPWEDALRVIGEDLIIFGCLDPTIFAAGDVARISPQLDALITPRLRHANFVLCPMADGIAVDLERFLAVKEWVEKQQG